MIREFKSTDLDKVMAIWLQGNEQAHNFIDSNFFKQNFDIVKMLIPMSTVYVQDLDGVKGFIGITENYISGLFVEQNYRQQGTGKALVNKAKQRYNQLFVHVYKKNTDAINFFLSQNFEIISESINEESNESELLLRCDIEHNVKIGKCAL
ncbi:GNAT family N-acetyltransferase [Gilliamella sp. B2776]|uniref:GNAT family N-acetyltransferase n=1 Tax=unclassified Gilliamella TaxID=2685620 RepID=UPI002269823F|nr:MULTISPECIES: GNAT family N-acetyltransferase [unclassified Gilliamella]MCX8650474.1 GNAT family N-acetyltransferase [Gilliamella sp. B2779]MCX8654480.1 GNAT family N-acetyltransferase [Gilliamella sp. B2737]MCX8656779.1 GNAT family N-acetyltransferase [Gilliamella sp. B2894]MCX8692322.1 GNAT family N-acetyltransferase [Gilliamella sp. B2776]MCX8694215.1 GNAT family N-acetyltransferase [Gilliamella sp. B2881]